MKNIKNYILKLQDKVRYHKRLYYFLDTPEISDEEYDFLIKKLNTLEQKYKNSVLYNNSPTQLVGLLDVSAFKKVNHISSMLSLDNVFSINDFVKFYNKVTATLNLKSLVFCNELKIDGVAINLVYKKGKLLRAITRGDGITGEDVTENAHMISSIPLTLKGNNIPDLLEVRGEVFMLKSDLLKLNNQSIQSNKKLFANTRNATSGSLRQLNCKITELRNLMFCCYGMGYCSDDKYIFDSHFLNLKTLQICGLPISGYNFLCSSITDILNFYKNIQEKRYFLNFDIDGIVVKVDSVSFQKKLGSSRTAPKWAIAFKFLNKIKKTRVANILYQIGRTGVITPVAEVDPICISGAIIRKVSLHNFREIQRLNLYIGDTVLITRSGDVIPKIISVSKESRSLSCIKKILFPKVCPECGSNLKIFDQGVKIRCLSGLKCSGQFKKLLNHFCSNQGFSIYGLGDKIINKLVNHGYVKNVLDLFNLDVSLLKKIDKIGEKKALNIKKSISNSKTISFSKFLCALGIPKIGSVVTNRISNYFYTVENLINACQKDLLLVRGIGIDTADILYKFFHNDFNKKMIFDLLKILNIYSENNTSNFLNKKNYLFGKKIVFSGSLINFSRSEIKKISEQLGLIVVSSISKSVNFIILGKNPGHKLIKAKKFNIPSIHEKEFLKMLDINVNNKKY